MIDTKLFTLLIAMAVLLKEMIAMRGDGVFDEVEIYDDEQL